MCQIKKAQEQFIPASPNVNLMVSVKRSHLSPSLLILTFKIRIIIEASARWIQIVVRY